MSTKQEAIRNAARAVKAHGFTLPADLDKQIAGLENPQYRVAVVGEYQVGKSTLINRVFLGDRPILSEGHGLCNTAVATDVEYGPTAKMEVFDWTDSHQEKDVLVKTVDNPTEDDVEDATVATATETRAELAKKRSRVRIQMPNEALRGFIVIDTPGLDDPEGELLLNTTWRVIPSADVALLVVDCKKLPESADGKPVQGRVPGRVMDLLKKKIMGESGIARLMVLVSCKPSDGFHAKQRAEVLSAIKSQLAAIGRDNIPVEMYCFDSAIEDILNSSDRILLKLSSFLEQNALPGREERVSNLLRAELENDLVEIAAKLTASGKSDAERAALAAKVAAEVATFKEKAEEAFDRFQNEVKALNANTKRDVDIAVAAVFDKFYAELAEKETVDAMKKVLAKAETTLKSDLQDKISIIGLKLKSDINALIARYCKDMENAGQGWSVFLEGELNIKTGMVAKIPVIVWDGLEIILKNLILPGGWIIAVIVHLLTGQTFAPAKWLVKKEILREVKNALEEAKPDTGTQIMQQVDAGITKTFNDVKTAMETSNKTQVEAIRSALATVPTGAGDRAALESAKTDLEAAIATL
ncbi:MAG: dynamin family protein [Kiritimatiellae bacterium]|nr:dynamin family protein [Kiritimatiellia bacterium]